MECVLHIYVPLQGTWRPSIYRDWQRLVWAAVRKQFKVFWVGLVTAGGALTKREQHMNTALLFLGNAPHFQKGKIVKWKGALTQKRTEQRTRF